VLLLRKLLCEFRLFVYLKKKFKKGFAKKGVFYLAYCWSDQKLGNNLKVIYPLPLFFEFFLGNSHGYSEIA
jgi:hypothetical protein